MPYEKRKKVREKIIVLYNRLSTQCNLLTVILFEEKRTFVNSIKWKWIPIDAKKTFKIKFEKRKSKAMDLILNFYSLVEM